MVAYGGIPVIISILITSLVVFLVIALTTLGLFAITRIKSLYLAKPPAHIKQKSHKIFTKNEDNISKFRAIILCDRIPPDSAELFTVSGHADCETLFREFQGNLKCRHGCLGLGSCATVCPADAIILKKGRIYITDQCTGCGSCVPVCPKNLISLVPIAASQQWFCPVHEHEKDFDFCITAKAGCKIEQSDFPKTRFKILQRWGILENKLR